MVKNLESIVEDYLIKQAKIHNCLCYKFTAPGRRGVPDRILIGFGQTIFIETKKQNGKPRDQQVVVIKQMRQHGAIVCIIDNKEDIDRLFNQLTNNSEVKQ